VAAASSFSMRPSTTQENQIRRLGLDQIVVEFASNRPSLFFLEKLDQSALRPVEASSILQPLELYSVPWLGSIHLFVCERKDIFGI
jgi:hypothetical protein